MKRIIAFGASNSRSSINKKFATWASSQLADVEVHILDLNDFEMPLFGVDRQKSSGIPKQAQAFIDAIASADGLIISLTEHNGSYSTAFKNLVDWATRIEKSVWQQKPMLLLSTAPGARGGKSVMQSALSSFPHWGAKITSNFSLPNFGENFHENDGILNTELRTEFQKDLDAFKEAITY